MRKLRNAKARGSLAFHLLRVHQPISFGKTFDPDHPPLEDFEAGV